MVFLAAFFIQDLFALALSTAVPINTCCPPGHFLAIEDWKQSWQNAEGHWNSQGSPASRTLSQLGPGSRPGPPGEPSWYTDTEQDMVERVYTDRYMAGLFYRNIPIPYNHHNKYDWDDIPERHVFMSRVFCVPDKNNMPSLDGATATEGKTLAQDQVLQSQGFFAAQA